MKSDASTCLLTSAQMMEESVSRFEQQSRIAKARRQKFAEDKAYVNRAFAWLNEPLDVYTPIISFEDEEAFAQALAAEKNRVRRPANDRTTFVQAVAHK